MLANRLSLIIGIILISLSYVKSQPVYLYNFQRHGFINVIDNCVNFIDCKNLSNFDNIKIEIASLEDFLVCVGFYRRENEVFDTCRFEEVSPKKEETLIQIATNNNYTNTSPGSSLRAPKPFILIPSPFPDSIVSFLTIVSIVILTTTLFCGNTILLLIAIIFFFVMILQSLSIVT
jgi:hypothetical protein